MVNISVHLLSKDLPDDSPLWEKYAWRVRAVRLDSLKLDPDSFISKYESEVKQPVDFTIGRLKERNAWTILVVRTPDEEASEDPNVLLRDDTEYVGFCVMIDVRTMDESMARREGFDEQKKSAWFMAAVYVDRSVRGTGTGKKMIQYGIDKIRDVSRATGTEDAVCVTSVAHGNTNAMELYKKLGFQVTNEDHVEEKEGHPHHMTELKMTL